jgi:hypothetical protein
LLNRLEDGDVLIVTNVDRLGRNALDRRAKAGTPPASATVGTADAAAAPPRGKQGARGRQLRPLQSL